MATKEKTTMLTIQHVDHPTQSEISEKEFNGFQSRVKEKYTIVASKEVTTPSELENQN